VHDRPITDAELVLLARAGEADALGALPERHRAPLYAAALTVLGDRAGAMDAVQETFVVALTRLESIRDPGAVGGRPRGEWATFYRQLHELPER
jgi:RNA polymerase sigma-70 factor (ECF subfamily)